MTTPPATDSTRGALDAQQRARFDRLCTGFRPDLLRFCIWLARDRALADDVVQETMLRAWNHIDSLQDEKSARAWLLTIARRELARVFQRKRLPTENIDDLSPSDEGALGVSDSSDADDVRDAIWQLPTEYREPLIMQVLLGYSTQEIADQMESTQGAVLTRLFRAREKLREILGPSPEDEAD